MTIPYFGNNPIRGLPLTTWNSGMWRPCALGGVFRAVSANLGVDQSLALLPCFVRGCTNRGCHLGLSYPSTPQIRQGCPPGAVNRMVSGYSAFISNVVFLGSLIFGIWHDVPSVSRFDSFFFFCSAFFLCDSVSRKAPQLVKSLGRFTSMLGVDSASHREQMRSLPAGTRCCKEQPSIQ